MHVIVAIAVAIAITVRTMQSSRSNIESLAAFKYDSYREYCVASTKGVFAVCWCANEKGFTDALCK